MANKCACDNHGKKHCGTWTDRVLSVDMDIPELPLCQTCWYVCWLGPDGKLEQARAGKVDRTT